MVAIIVTEGAESLACGGCGATLGPITGVQLWDTDQNSPLCTRCAATAAPLLVALLKLAQAEGLIETARRETKDRKDVSDAFEAERRAHDRGQAKRPRLRGGE